MEEVAIRKRLSREESRAQTRERLLDASYDIFARDGIEAASIEDVAEAAGYSRGAFYSNFESKDDLLCALMDRDIQREHERFEEIIAAPAPQDQLIPRVRAYYVGMATDQRSCAFWLGLQLYAVSRPALRQRVAEMLREKRKHVITQVDRVFAASGIEPPVSAEIIAFGLISIAQGMGLSQTLDPASISQELLPEALGKLFDRVAGV